MKVFECIIDDGKNVFKSIIPATSSKSLKSEYQGNGEFIKIKDVTADYPISINKVMEALTLCEFGATEIQIITIALHKSIENKIE